jgi:xanthine dehydrogenase large subunit
MQRPVSPLMGTKIDGGVGEARWHDSAHKHVTGTAIYTDDIPEPPGTLQIYIAMSERAHARITKLDVSKVRKSPGVAAVLTGAEIPGDNDLSPTPTHDDPMFADGLVQYFGQSIFAVAAETIGEARAAAKMALIEYQDLPAAFARTALRDGEGRR